MKVKNGKTNNKILIVVLVAVVGIIAFVLFGTSSSDLEEGSKPIIDQILQEQFDLNRSCDDVTITDDNGDNTYLEDYYPNKRIHTKFMMTPRQFEAKKISNLTDC